jgi:hypothetical protein
MLKLNFYLENIPDIYDPQLKLRRRELPTKKIRLRQFRGNEIERIFGFTSYFKDDAVRMFRSIIVKKDDIDTICCKHACKFSQRTGAVNKEEATFPKVVTFRCRRMVYAKIFFAHLVLRYGL